MDLPGRRPECVHQSVDTSEVAGNRDQLWLTLEANQEMVLVVVMGTHRTEEPEMGQMGIRWSGGSWWQELPSGSSQVIPWK